MSRKDKAYPHRRLYRKPRMGPMPVVSALRRLRKEDLLSPGLK